MTASTIDSWAQQRLGRRLIIVGASGLFLGLTGLVMTFAAGDIGPRAYGVLLTAFGLVQLIEVARTKVSNQRLLRAVLGLLYLVGGGTLAALSLQGSAATAAVVAVLIVGSGVTRAIWAHAWPGAPRILGYLTVVVYIALALAVLLEWPIWALWVAGCAASLDLAVYGATSVAVGLAVRGAPSDV